ncbi:MAG: type II toxin-antitoxin system HicA family toxin [Tannerella sp.]|nr:type II toxin-antitoxin system HicA family toxin [Tannerella sp.]
MKINECVRKLKKAGCYYLSHGGNHDWWFSPITGQKFQIPRHWSMELSEQTKKSIVYYSGVKL